MTRTHKFSDPLPLTTAAGLTGAALRMLLYRTGFDEKGILSSDHPLHLACLVLAVGTLGYLALRARKSEGEITEQPRLRFLLGLAAGCLMLLQGMILYRRTAAATDLSLWIAAPMSLYRRISTAMPLFRCALMALAGIAMGICVLPGKKNHPLLTLCHGIICVGFAADMLGRYQIWSGNPQLPDYVFHVPAGVALSLTAYQTLALYADLGKPRLQRFFCLSGLFLCLMCLAGPDSGEFYLSGALWSAVCLLTVMPPEEKTEEEQTDVPA